MRRRVCATGAALLVLSPGALVAGFGFHAGGFFAGTVAAGAILLGLALVLRITLAERPFAGLSVPFVVAAAALALLAVWTLISSGWSHAPARALVEYDRVLLYLLAFVLVGALGRTPVRLRWAIRSVALAAFAVCVCGFVTRALPDVWSVAPSVHNERLGYPVTYWNALGLLAAIGVVLCCALTSDARESRAGRVLAAAALPLLGATLLLTFSRGAVAAVIAGVVVVVVVGRPAALLSGAIAAAPAVFVAVRGAYDAELLATVDPTTAAATAQGHDLALLVALCALGAGAARAVLLLLDARVARVRVPARLRRRELRWAAALAPAVVVLAAALALGVPGEISSRYDGFVNEREVSDSGSVRSRLLAPGNNGRIDHWEVALDAYRENRLHGDGAGTYALRWDRDRTTTFQAEDGHSLYLEVLGELGLVGIGLLALALLLILGGFAALARGPDRMIGAALFAAGVTWALHAGVDWQWEMPAVTAWVFATGGLALAGRVDRSRAPAYPAGRSRPALRSLPRLLAAVGALLLLLVPLAIHRSQGPLFAAARAWSAGDCPTAIDRALASRDALAIRPEPYVLIGYCDVRLGRPRLAVRALERAARLDPDNWEMHYGLALVRAAAGLDPRPQARVAARLNPSDSDLATALVTSLVSTDDPRAWRRRALAAPLPLR
jgi:O-antigen ligase